MRVNSLASPVLPVCSAVEVAKRAVGLALSPEMPCLLGATVSATCMASCVVGLNMRSLA